MINNNLHVFACMQPKQRTSVITYQRYFKVGNWRCILSVLHLSLRPHPYSTDLGIFIKNVSGRTSFPLEGCQEGCSIFNGIKYYAIDSLDLQAIPFIFLEEG